MSGDKIQAAKAAVAAMSPVDRVRKVSGYKFPGVIVARFTTTAGAERVVVECTVPEVAGMLHIFNPSQIEPEEGPSP